MFIKYMDQIKAEDALKEKTRQYVEAVSGAHEAAGAVSAAARHRKPKMLVIRRFREMVTAAVVLAAVFIGGLAYYQMPVNFISMDINPSLELGINAFDRVVAVEAVNGDGLQLVERQRLVNASLEEAVQALVQEAVRQGYIQQDGASVVSLTAVSKKATAALQERLREAALQGLMEADAKAVVYTDGSDPQLRARAHERGLSAGKYKLILLLQELDPELDIEDYRNANIAALILKADSLLAASGFGNGQTAELQQAFRMVAAAALEIQVNEQRMLQNRNAEQNQTEGTGEPLLNRVQLRNQAENPNAAEQGPNEPGSQTQNQEQSPMDGQQVQTGNPSSNAEQKQSASQGETVLEQASQQESGQNQPDHESSKTIRR